MQWKVYKFFFRKKKRNTFFIYLNMKKIFGNEEEIKYINMSDLGTNDLSISVAYNFNASASNVLSINYS